METINTTKCIFNPAIARRLLRNGNPIIDIKPHKNYKDKTVFVFDVTEKFNSDLKAILSDRNTAAAEEPTAHEEPLYVEDYRITADGDAVGAATESSV